MGRRAATHEPATAAKRLRVVPFLVARGYASRTERKDEPDDVVVLDGVLDPTLCVICKKRPGETRGMCRTCHAALHS